METEFFKSMSPEEKIIFIVEDSEVYAKSLQTFIQNRFLDVKEIKTFRIGEMCLMELHHNPCIVIMDYFLNSKYKAADNGLEIIKRIKTQRPFTNIIVLSAQEEVEVALETVKQTDCYYIRKDKNAFNKVEHLISQIFNRNNFPAIESLN